MLSDEEKEILNNIKEYMQNDTNRLYTEMIERKNYFERELQKLEDKIKAKIEEYKDKCKKCNFRGKICKEFTKNYDCVIAVCLNEFYSLLEKEE